MYVSTNQKPKMQKAKGFKIGMQLEKREKIITA